MNRGLMLKAAFEIWPATLLCGALLFGVEAALAYVLPTFEAQLSDISVDASIHGRILAQTGGEIFLPSRAPCLPCFSRVHSNPQV